MAAQHVPQCKDHSNLHDQDNLCYALALECAIENWIDFTQCDPYELSRLDAPWDCAPEDAARLSSYGMAMAEIESWAVEYIDSDTSTCYRED